MVEDIVAMIFLLSVAVVYVHPWLGRDSLPLVKRVPCALWFMGVSLSLAVMGSA